MTHKGLGRIPDPPDGRDHQWRTLMLREAIELPTAHTAKFLARVLDQGQTPRCVAYSTAALKLHDEFREHRHYYNFDPDELYARCKEHDGAPNEDGTFLRVALRIAKRRGVIARTSRAATRFTIQSYVRLNSVQEIKEAIFTSGPVVFGIDVDAGIYQPADRGQLSGPTGNPVGGHAMLAVGWDDTAHANGSIRFKNSWGTGWGDHGFGFMPYEWFDVYSGWDAWRSVDVKEAAPPL